MLVLAAVSDLQYQRLRSAVAPDFALARAPTWDVALETIRGRPVEIAVVDPMLGGARGQEVERLRVLFPSLPLILYTPVMTPELAPVLLAMGKCGITQVVLSPTEDHPKRLRDLLCEEAMQSASYRLLDQLAPALAPLPTELRWVLQESMRSPGAVQTIQQVAARAHVDRGTCARWFARAGLPSPREILAAAGKAVTTVMHKPLGPIRLTVIRLRQKITPAIDTEEECDYEITKSLSHGHTGG